MSNFSITRTQYNSINPLSHTGSGRVLISEILSETDVDTALRAVMLIDGVYGSKFTLYSEIYKGITKYKSKYQTDAINKVEADIAVYLGKCADTRIGDYSEGNSLRARMAHLEVSYAQKSETLPSSHLAKALKNVIPVVVDEPNPPVVELFDPVGMYYSLHYMVDLWNDWFGGDDDGDGDGDCDDGRIIIESIFESAIKSTQANS